MKLFLIIVVISSLIGCKDAGPKQNASDSSDKNSQIECVKRIYSKDSVLGAARNLASENISISLAITNYTTGLESLDYTNCPYNFVTSFQEHIEAWKKVTIVTDKYPLIRGELHDIFSQLEKSDDSTEFKMLVKEVWDTWSKVEENALPD